METEWSLWEGHGRLKSEKAVWAQKWCSYSRGIPAASLGAGRGDTNLSPTSAPTHWPHASATFDPKEDGLLPATGPLHTLLSEMRVSCALLSARKISAYQPHPGISHTPGHTPGMMPPPLLSLLFPPVQSRPLHTLWPHGTPHKDVLQNLIHFHSNFTNVAAGLQYLQVRTEKSHNSSGRVTTRLAEYKTLSLHVVSRLGLQHIDFWRHDLAHNSPQELKSCYMNTCNFAGQWEVTRIFIRDSESSHSSSLPPSSSSCIRGDPPKNQNLLIKDCVFIVTCLNFSHLPSTPFDAVHLSRHFFHCSKQFLNLLILMPLVLLLFFFVSLPLYLHNVFPWGIFFTKEKK